jgi:hypothetical protein
VDAGLSCGWVSSSPCKLNYLCEEANPQCFLRFSILLVKKFEMVRDVPEQTHSLVLFIFVLALKTEGINDCKQAFFGLDFKKVLLY